MTSLGGGEIAISTYDPEGMSYQKIRSNPVEIDETEWQTGGCFAPSPPEKVRGSETKEPVAKKARLSANPLVTINLVLFKIRWQGPCL